LVAADRSEKGMAVVHRHDDPWPVGVDFLQRTVAAVDELAGGVLLGPPPEARTTAGPARPLPLGLRREVVGDRDPLRVAGKRLWVKPVGAGGTFCSTSSLKPVAKILRIRPADVNHRMLVFQLERPGETRFAPLRSRPVLPFGFLVVGVAAALFFH